jgi:maltoporin
MKFKLLPLTVALAAALSPLTASATDAPEDFVFSGYARYGLHYSNNAKHYVRADGQLTNNSVGRLGNESNGGEFQLTKGFQGANDSIWTVAVMVDNYSDKVGLKKFYARGTNLFEAQPNATFWAGRDFHQRPQTNLSDYFWMTHDGQGAGVYDLELGPVKLDLAAVGQANSGTGDNGNYAITSKLHSIDHQKT